jgi:uncharacterized integral membrane protein (TIGR00698 family)
LADSGYIYGMNLPLLATARTQLTQHAPGVAVCVAIALVATFLSSHFGGPQLLYALLLGLSFHFLVKKTRVKKGVDFCGRTVLRLGVALLGARITLPQVAQLGWATALAVAMGLVLTVLSGVLLARWLGRSREEGLLSGGAVAICGASAALAISSVLPPSKATERFTLLTVVGVTVLSTVAMVLYPFALQFLPLTAVQKGIFLGGTIHDVAQVVAAGMILGPQAGDTATVVKLFRVMLLMPVVFVIALLYRRTAEVRDNEEVKDQSMPLVPSFLLAFVVLMLLASSGVFSTQMVGYATDASRALLVVAIAAAGVKTSFEDILKLGWQPVAMLVAETLWIALWVLGCLLAFGVGGH